VEESKKLKSLPQLSVFANSVVNFQCITHIQHRKMVSHVAVGCAKDTTELINVSAIFSKHPMHLNELHIIDIEFNG